MKKIFTLLCCLCALGACENKPQPPQQVPFKPQPAADQVSAEQTTEVQVGPLSVSRQDFEERVALLPEEDRTFAATSVGRRNLLNLMAREKLAVLDAKDKGLDRSDIYLTALEDKRRQLAEIYQSFSEDLLIRLWEERLQEQGITHVTEEEINAYYKKYPYEMTIKQIIIPDAQTADAVYRELKHNKSRWKELERQYSTAPYRSKNKEFSFMPGEFIAELEVIAANSPAGSVQGFIKTAQGFHIIMKTAEKRLSLKDAAPRIRAILENQKTDAALNALQNKYKVVIYEQDE